MSVNNKITNTSAEACTHLTIKKLISESYIWDSFLQTTLNSCFTQAWSWADFKELEGYKTFRYGLFLNKQLVGGCIFYLYPHSSKANLLIAPGGPILPKQCPEQGLHLLLEIATVIAKEMGAIALRIEPLWAQKLNCVTGFVRAPADMLPSETLLIDLCLPESKILAGMKPKGRYNLRLSWRYGVETEFRNDSQVIPLFYDLFWETVQRQQFFGEPYGFFINLCQTLFPVNMAEIGLASWHGEILAAILVVYWGNHATYLYGGRSLNHPEVMANYALHFRAMQRAKTRGCQFYDFYGFTSDSDHTYAKFSQFKSQFGGESITTIGAYDYFFYDQLADTLINLFQNVAGNHK